MGKLTFISSYLNELIVQLDNMTTSIVISNNSGDFTAIASQIAASVSYLTSRLKIKVKTSYDSMWKLFEINRFMGPVRLLSIADPID